MASKVQHVMDGPVILPSPRDDSETEEENA